MKVSELIQKKRATIHTAPATATVAEAARILLETEVSSLLVLEGDTASGIFTKNDLLRRYLESPTGFDRKELRDVQSKPLFSTELDANLNDVFAEMVDRGIHHAPVFDGGKAVGMITPIDILLYLKEAVRHENEHLIRYIQGSY